MQAEMVGVVVMVCLLDGSFCEKAGCLCCDCKDLSSVMGKCTLLIILSNETLQMYILGLTQ